MLRLIVYVGDNVADKSIVEIHIASFFVCFDLTLASLLKLCHVRNNLGFIDGIASVTLSIFTHYCKSETLRIIGGIFKCCYIGKEHFLHRVLWDLLPSCSSWRPQFDIEAVETEAHILESK